MANAPKVQGPASYFPSIEKKYGQPMTHWFALVETRSGTKHMEIVNWLKAEHSMGHGHANAVVAYCLAQKR
jgi:Domain of unknown function (DUF4287)